MLNTSLKPKKKNGVAKLSWVLQHNEASQQVMRRNAAKPGQGRERMWKKFAGYIPANRAEKFREVDLSRRNAMKAERRWAKLPAFEGTFADFPQKLVRARPSSPRLRRDKAVPAFN